MNVIQWTGMGILGLVSFVTLSDLVNWVCHYRGSGYD